MLVSIWYPQILINQSLQICHMIQWVYCCASVILIGRSLLQIAKIILKELCGTNKDTSVNTCVLQEFKLKISIKTIDDAFYKIGHGVITGNEIAAKYIYHWISMSIEISSLK